MESASHRVGYFYVIADQAQDHAKQVGDIHIIIDDQQVLQSVP